jgi:tRNA threonylcarbamoyladenosine biosynthesis protein TsaB
VIDARRGEVYVQAFDDALKPLFEPALTTIERARLQLASVARPVVIAGSGAGLVASEDTETVDIRMVDARTLAHAALGADPDAHPPAPCYLRAPDARLPS